LLLVQMVRSLPRQAIRPAV